VFESRVLRTVFRPKREEVVGGWRRLHSEELHDLYALPNFINVIKSRRMSGAGHVACMGELRNAYNILVGKPEEKRPAGRPGCRWADHIRVDLGEGTSDGFL